MLFRVQCLIAEESCDHIRIFFAIGYQFVMTATAYNAPVVHENHFITHAQILKTIRILDIVRLLFEKKTCT